MPGNRIVGKTITGKMMIESVALGASLYSERRENARTMSKKPLTVLYRHEDFFNIQLVQSLLIFHRPSARDGTRKNDGFER
jgi:hypothetical protein